VAARLWPTDAFDDGLVRERVTDDGVLKQAEEEQTTVSGCSSVETKDKLVEIVWKVLMAHSALVRSQKPTLEKGDRQVNQFTRSIAHAGITAFDDVIVSCRRQCAVWGQLTKRIK